MATSRLLAENPDAIYGSSSSQYDPAVARLQQTLNAEGYRDPSGKALAVDGIMGPLTTYALNQKTSSMASGVATPITTSGPINYTIGPGNTIVGSRGGKYMGFSQYTPTSGGMSSSVRNTPTSISSMNPEIGKLLSALRTKSSASLPSVESTAQYKAAKDQLQQEGAEASTRAVQTMAAKGILRSSSTETALKKIEQAIVDKLTTQIAPAVQQQLLAERENELSGIRSDLATALQMAGMDASQATQAAQMAEQGRQFDIGAMIDKARLEQQIGQQKMQNLYELAGLTGTIPEGLPGAGQLTADEQYRRQTLAAQLAKLNEPKETNMAQDIRNSLLQGLNAGTIKESDLQPWQRELLGLGTTQQGGITDNALLNMALEQARASGLLIDDPEYIAKVSQIYRQLKAMLGGGVAAPTTNTQTTQLLTDEELLRRLEE